MKLFNRQVLAALLVAATATAVMAQGALADQGCGRDAGYRGARNDRVYRGRDTWHASVNQRWAEARGRSYFYRDCQTGRVDSYISNLRPGYGRHARPARVEKVDRASGRVIATYVWDRDQWCETGNADVAGRGFAERFAYDGPGDWSYGR